jgi:hypothetical protein
MDTVEELKKKCDFLQYEIECIKKKLIGQTTTGPKVNYPGSTNIRPVNQYTIINEGDNITNVTGGGLDTFELIDVSAQNADNSFSALDVREGSLAYVCTDLQIGKTVVLNDSTVNRVSGTTGINIKWYTITLPPNPVDGDAIRISLNLATSIGAWYVLDPHHPRWDSTYGMLHTFDYNILTTKVQTFVYSATATCHHMLADPTEPPDPNTVGMTGLWIPVGHQDSLQLNLIV